MRLASISITIAIAASVLGCGESPVADDLAQRDANRIVAELRSRGIEAVTSKERGAKGRYSVSVPSSKFGDAAVILNQLGLPGESKPSFSELVEPSGILPSSREVESLRLDRASAAEIETLLSGHPAVVSVGALVRVRSIHAGDSPTVSVVIQKRAGASVDEASLRDLITRSVPGMKPDGVMVTIAEQSSPPVSLGVGAPGDPLVPFLVFWRVPQGDYGGLSFLLVGLLVFISGLAALGGYIFGQYNFSRHAEALRLDTAHEESKRLASPDPEDADGAGLVDDDDEEE
jgi:type III secretory pathway lipoprotein EscJ